MELSSVLFAFALTLFAGLATGIGGALSLLTKKRIQNSYLFLWDFQQV